MRKGLSPAIRRETAEFDRGLSFFDAVYGFAITLLIANVDMPSPDAWSSIGTLFSGALGTQLLGFVISFVVIAVFWKANYDLIGRFTGMNGTVIIANLVAVGLVVLIPFTTQGISDPGTVDLPLPNALYAFNIMLAILAQMTMFELARRSGLVAVGDPPAALWAGRIDALVKVVVFAVSILVAFQAGPTWARYIWLSLLVIGPISGSWSNRRTLQAREAVGMSSNNAERGEPGNPRPAPTAE